MEKHPIRDRFNKVVDRLGRAVVGGLERHDDALDVWPDRELDDTQPIDISALLAAERNDDAA